MERQAKDLRPMEKERKTGDWRAEENILKIEG
jgi:hypothetical protein